jgi:CubicO group peptidase (beta-lactamase class C family)
MAVSTPALIEINPRTIEGRAAAGIAVVSGAGARPEAVWVPASAFDEPAYLAYSITKTFTAVLILQLRDEQRLTLDDRLARWFPRIDRSDRISLGQLLNHHRRHSGLRLAGFVPRRGPRRALVAVVVRALRGRDVREGAALRSRIELGLFEPGLHAAQANRRGHR